MNKHYEYIFYKNDPLLFAGRIERSKSDERGYKQTWKWTWCKLKKLFSSLMASYNHVYIKVYSTPKIFKNFVYIPPPQQCFAKYMYM